MIARANKKVSGRYRLLALGSLVLILAAGLLSTNARVAKGDGGDGLAPLSSVAIPGPTGGDIIDQAAAIRLGKVFFWDIQVGGDGQIACATCHFHGGADNRQLNTLHPGIDGIFNSGGVTGPGQLFQSVSIVNDDRVGSQGIVGSLFQNVDPDPSVAADVCAPEPTAPFLAHRRVAPRNAPTVFGAVFNRQNLWDGRANDAFNGIDLFGATANAGAPLGSLLPFSSLASQAAGTPNNPVIQSCRNRPFNGANSLASKLLARPALQHQLVDPTDSALAGLSNAPGLGLKCGNHLCTYTELIAAAFGPAMAANAQNVLSRLWGQAVQAYVATLVPSQTPLDRYLAGDRRALTRQQERGLGIFTGKGQCKHCHSGPELTDASVSFAAKRGLINEDGGDQGFHNIGVRPTDEDLGRGGLGPKGASFSESGSAMDRGAFKTPGLRNVKLTAPYFHNGGKATLGEVVDFYNRGGDFANTEQAPRIKRLSLSAKDKAALVDFLTNGLTDCRVEKKQGPFDGPSLPVPNGPVVPANGAAGLGNCH